MVENAEYMTKGEIRKRYDGYITYLVNVKIGQPYHIMGGVVAAYADDVGELLDAIAHLEEDTTKQPQEIFPTRLTGDMGPLTEYEVN
jgi:hypothetical protein